MAIGVAATAGAAPVAVNDTYVMTSLTLNVSAPGFLANDSGGPGLQAVLIADNVDYGTLTAFADGHFTYTRTPGFTANDSFRYRVSDGTGFAEATVTIDVSSLLPTARDDTYIVTSPSFTVASPGFLANDTGPGLQAVLIVDSVDHGTLAAFADGHFTYTPDPGFAGIDAFTYRATNGFGNVEATVTLDVSTNLPVGINDIYATPANTALAVSAPGFLGNDQGGYGGLRATVISDNVDHGLLSAFTDGHFNYTPDGGFIGIDQFSYRFADGLGRISTATAFIYVGIDVPVGPPPARVPEPASLLLSLSALGMLAAARRRRA